MPPSDIRVYEHEFVYRLDFPATNVWNEKQDSLYWLAIQAVYDNRQPGSYPWGWAHSMRKWRFGATSVGSSLGAPYVQLRHPGSPPWVPSPYGGHPYAGEPIDMAYMLMSDVCPARCTKWRQPPDMIEGTDMTCWTVTNAAAAGITSWWRADDFVSDGRPITDIHWWGSYVGWEVGQSGTATNPVPPPKGSARVRGFNLGWYLDSGTCAPGTQLTNIYVSITNCHEVFYGTVTQFWNEGVGDDNNEHEYQYYVDLLDPYLDAGPWYELAGTHYWLSVQAVFDPAVLTNTSHKGWGWKIAPPMWESCPSVESTNGTNWAQAFLVPPHPRAGEPFDLAFELTTTNTPPTNLAVAVAFTNMAVYTNWNEVWLWSTGHCGCGYQVLQESPDLMQSNGWADVGTNLHARPEYLWIANPIYTQRFYRVMQRP
jgi:hypothetical protein